MLFFSASSADSIMDRHEEAPPRCSCHGPHLLPARHVAVPPGCFLPLIRRLPFSLRVRGHYSPPVIFIPLSRCLFIRFWWFCFATILSLRVIRCVRFPREYWEAPRYLTSFISLLTALLLIHSELSARNFFPKAPECVENMSGWEKFANSSVRWRPAARASSVSRLVQPAESHITPVAAIPGGGDSGACKGGEHTPLWAVVLFWRLATYPLSCGEE